MYRAVALSEAAFVGLVVHPFLVGVDFQNLGVIGFRGRQISDVENALS